MVDVPRQGVKRKKRIRMAIFSVLAVAAFGAVTYAVWNLEPAAPSVDGGTLWMGEVQRGEMVRQVRGPGTLVPERIWWVPAQTQGRIEQIFVKPGRIVKADTILLELSNPQLVLDALEAEWQLKKAEANLKDLQVRLESETLNQQASAAAVKADFEEARLRAERDEDLAKGNLISQLDYRLSKVRADELATRHNLEQQRLDIRKESTAAQVASQEAEIARLRALHELRRREVADLQVRAGVDGVLQQVPVEVGQQVSAGSNLARIAQPQTLIAELRIAETQAKDITIGQKASIDARNGIIEGTVTRIDPAVREGTVTVDVDLSGPLPTWARPDLSVDGTIEIERLDDVIYVNRPAHGQSDSLISLFKLVKDGTEATRVQVKLGRSSVNTIEVVEGLQEHDRVILSDMSRWEDYNRIRLN